MGLRPRKASPSHARAPPRHRFFRLLLLPALLVAGVLTLVLLTDRLAPGDDDDRVRIRGVDYLGDLPTLVADKQGFFEAEGVKPVVEYGVSGKQNLVLLRAGETDFALMALTPLVIDLLNDDTPGQADDPVILASLVHSTDLNQVVSLRGSHIERPADLQNRRIGVMKGTNAEFVWWLFATYHGFDATSARLIDKPVETLAKALLDGEIDAAVLWEPWTSRLRGRAGDALRTHPGSKLYTAKWVVAALRQTVAEQPEATRAMLGAYRAAIDFMDREETAAFDLYARRTEESREALTRLRNKLSFELSLDWSLVATMQQQAEWARQAGYAKNARAPDVLALIDSEPLHSMAPLSVGLSLLDTDVERSAP